MWAFRRKMPKKNLGAVSNQMMNSRIHLSLFAIAATKVLPVNAKFESLNGLDPGGSYIFDVWSVRIRMDRPDGSSYAFLIRQRVVGSRALQEDVARLDSHIDVENVAGWVGGYRILDRQKELVARIYTRIEE